jgi:tetratricopeptide (TPR) repeat protein
MVPCGQSRVMWVQVALGILIVTAVTACSASPQEKGRRYLDGGKQYVQKGDYQNAVIQFRSALKLDPRSVDALYALAQAELSLHEWIQAVSALDQAIELDPERQDVRLTRGNLYLAARDFSKAAADGAAIVEKDPQNGAAYRLLGAALAGQQQNVQAVQAFTRAAALAAKDPVPAIDLALVEMGLHRFADAEAHLRQAIALDPGAISAYVNLATALRLEGKPAAAIDVLQQAVTSNPNAIDLYVTAADLLASQHKPNDAEALLARLRTRAPTSADAALAIGWFYARHGERSRAVAEYDRGLAIAPADQALKKRLVDAYLITGQTQQAAALDQELMKDAPHDTMVHVNHARVLTAQGRFDDAVTQLQRDSSDAADSPQVHYYLAMAYWGRGDLSLARRELETALQLAPDLRIARKTAIDLCLAQKDLPAADRYGLQYVRQYPDDESGHIAMGVTDLREGKTAPARREFLTARQLAPTDPVPALDLAQAAEAEHQWVDAEAQLEAALRIDARSVVALGQLADYWVGRKQPEKAVARVQQYLKAFPDTARAYLILGSLMLGTRHDAEAQVALERAMQLDPSLMTAYVRLGQLYQQERQTPVAIARYEKALQLQPNQVWLCTLIGNLYLDEGNVETAKTYYERALTIKPDFGIAAGNLAWLDVQQGSNLDVALGLAQKAKQLNPESVPIADTLGWIMYKKGLTPGAVRLLQECVQKMPDFAQYHYHLGKALMADGDLSQAKTELETALRLKLSDPDAADAKKTLATIG